MIPSLRSSLALAALCALAACGDGGTEPPGPPTSVDGVAGNNQVGTVAQALANPIRVRVTDAGGRGVGGVEVDFEVTAGGGSVVAGAIGGLSANGSSLSTAAVPVQTDMNGEAETGWTLGSVAGTQRATATVEGLPPVAFTATAEPGPAASIVAMSGDNQAAPTGSELADPFVATVQDEFENVVPAVAVSWEVTAGGGSLSTASSTTDAAGTASSLLTLGNVTANSVTATAAGLPPLTFNATGLTANVADPTGDGFATSASANLVAPDIVRISSVIDASNNLVVQFEFVDDVSLTVTSPNHVTGFLDFDTDQDAATGIQPATDLFRPAGVSGSTGIGTDFFVQMIPDNSGNYAVGDAGSNLVGTLTPNVSGNRLTMVIPLSVLGGDDGNLDMAAILGTVQEPTDLVPNDGALSASPNTMPIVRPSESPASTGRARRSIQLRAPRWKWGVRP